MKQFMHNSAYNYAYFSIDISMIYHHDYINYHQKHAATLQTNGHIHSFNNNNTVMLAD